MLAEATGATASWSTTRGRSSWAAPGPEAARLAGIEGVDLLGFVQPDSLPALLARSGCLVLPSRFEPWGVVVHEAAAAGLPVVCTSVAGAASRLVLDGYNGVVVPPGDPGALARALLRISGASDAERAGTWPRPAASSVVSSRPTGGPRTC